MQPKDFLLYYAAIFVVAAILIMRRKPRKKMLLKMRAKDPTKSVPGKNYSDIAKALKGAQPLGEAIDPDEKTEISSGERSLNVVFNYNGHSWDAYEVLGLPAGSATESVERAYQESLKRVDATSKPFIEAAYAAIATQRNYKRIGQSGQN